MKAARPELFDEAARREAAEEECVIEVVDVRIPKPGEFGKGEDLDSAADLPLDESQEWWDIEPDGDDFERNTARASEERGGFENRPTRVGVELLALYLPFHFYPTGTGGSDSSSGR